MHEVHYRFFNELFGFCCADKSCSGRVNKDNLAFAVNSDDIGAEFYKLAVVLLTLSQCLLNLLALVDVCMY